jgi:integrase
MKLPIDKMVELMGIEPTASRVRFSGCAGFEEMFSLYEQQQTLDSCSRAGMYAAQRLKKSFTGFSVEEITALRINEHVLRRVKSGASNGTVNRELAALGKMFTLAQRFGVAKSAPYIPHLKEAPARRGFVEPKDFQKLLSKITEPVVRQVIEFLYLSGWRKNEVLRLDWAHVGPDEVWLDPAHSKSGESRLLPLEGRLAALIKERRGARAGALVFHRRGKRIWDFRKAWYRATKDAEREGLLVHDLRRSAVRNLVRARVPEGVAMKITGHKTRNVFERYNIVSEADLRAAISSVTQPIT